MTVMVVVMMVILVVMFKFSDILGACDWDSDWDNSD